MDEKALSAAARRGDVRAFNELVLAHQALMFNVAYRLLGDRDAASDVVHEAVLAAFRDACRFQHDTPRSWLLCSVIHRCYEKLRAPGHSRACPVADRHPAQALPRALLSLSPEQRAAVVLSDVQGLSYREIADVLHVSRATVESQLSQARLQLRNALQASHCCPPLRRP